MEGWRGTDRGLFHTCQVHISTTAGMKSNYSQVSIRRTVFIKQTGWDIDEK